MEGEDNGSIIVSTNLTKSKQNDYRNDRSSGSSVTVKYSETQRKDSSSTYEMKRRKDSSEHRRHKYYDNSNYKNRNYNSNYRNRGWNKRGGKYGRIDRNRDRERNYYDRDKYERRDYYHKSRRDYDYDSYRAGKYRRSHSKRKSSPRNYKEEREKMRERSRSNSALRIMKVSIFFY